MSGVRCFAAHPCVAHPQPDFPQPPFPAPLPPQHEARIVQAALQAVARAATALWPQSRTLLFGSQATGLALPGSDLDIVVLGVSEDLQSPAAGFTWCVDALVAAAGAEAGVQNSAHC